MFQLIIRQVKNQVRQQFLNNQNNVKLI